MTKSLYKDLVTVVKDPETQDIVCRSFVFKVTSVDGGVLFLSQNKEHPQNAFYVIVDPVNWHVTLLCNRWEDYW